MNKDYTVAFLVLSADLGFSFLTAQRYKNDAVSLKAESRTCTPSFHLLSSLAFELFAKCLLGYEICLENKSNPVITELELRDKIKNRMKNISHKLHNIPGALPEFCDFLNIAKIEQLKNDRVWEYHVHLKKDGDFFALKDLEAIRYGSFAKKKDIATICVFDQKIIDFLDRAEAYVSKKREETMLELMKHLKPKP